MDDRIRIPSLVGYLPPIPEYRAARGRRQPLLALPPLVGVATLSGARSQTAIAARGRDRGQPWLQRLGCTRDRAPRQPPRSRRFARLAPQAAGAAVRQWAGQALRRCPPAAGGLAGVALDGKTLRGGARRTPTCWPPSATGWGWSAGSAASWTRPTRSARRARCCSRWRQRGGS